MQSMLIVLQEAEVVALPRIIVKRWPGAGIDILVEFHQHYMYS